MRAQRVRVGESRAEMQFTKWTAEGAVKGSGGRSQREMILSILRRVGIRQLPGICWYLAERTEKP